MKKHLLKVFLLSTVVATSGMMFTSCKDYDDDIDKVNDRLDQLETGKLASVEQQIAAINSSISSLEAAYKAADAELKTALEKQASDLATAKSDLEAAIKSLDEAHDADIKKLSDDLSTLSSKVEGYNKTLSEEIAAVVKDLADNYYDKKTIDEKLAALDSKFAGQISALDAKIAACDKAIGDIKTSIETMTEQISGKVDKSDYEKFTEATNEELQKNAQSISALEALCAGFSEGQTIKGYIDAAKEDVVGMLGELKETYEAFVEAYNELKLDERLATAEGEIDALQQWKEELMKEETGTLALLEQRLQEAINAKTTLDEVKKTYTATCKEFLDGVNEVIKEALSEEGENKGLITKYLDSKLETLKTSLQDQIDALELRIDALEGQVSDLAGRIQSLVYVPKTIDGFANFGGLVLTAGDQTIRLTTGAKSEMTFLVSPKTLATKLAAQHNATKDVFSFVPEKVTRADAAPKFEIEGDVVGSVDGKITMLVSTDYTYPKATEFVTATETYAIALKVTSKSSASKAEEESSVDTSIEYTTAFIPTIGGDENLVENIVLAKEEGEGEEKKFVEFPAAGAEYEKVYNKVNDPWIMLEEYGFAYKMGETIMSLDKAAEQGKWDVKLASKPVYTRSKWAVTGGMSKVTFDPVDPMDAEAKSDLVKITIDEAVASNVGKTITDEVAMAIHAVDGTDNVATNNGDAYVAKTTLTRFQLPAIENLDATIAWNYTRYSAGGQYSVNNIIFDAAGAKKLTMVQYEQFKTAVTADNSWEVLNSDGTVNTGVKVAINTQNLPDINTDGDAKFFSYFITGYKGGSGTLNIEKTIELGRAEEITLRGTITFEGLPTDLVYRMDMPEAKIATYGRDVLTVIAQENFAKEAVYELLPEGQTFFANADEFLAFMRQSTNPGEMENNEQKNTTTQALEAAVRYNGISEATASSSRDRLCVDFQRSYVDFSKDEIESYTFTAPDGACYKIADAVFSIAIEGSVTINKDQSFHLAQGTSINADGNVVVMGTAYPNGIQDPADNTKKLYFTVDEINLLNAYNAAYPEDADPSKVGLEFTLAATTPEVTPIPEISNGTNVKSDTWTMDWNNCGLNSVEVVATMTYENVPVDSKTFKVILTNPIDITSWGTNFTTLATQIAVKTAATVNVWEKVLAAKNYGTPKAMLPRDIFGNELVSANGVTDFATGAYEFDVKFGEASYSSTVIGTKDFARFNFDPESGNMNVSASDDLLGGKVTAQIQVIFVYKYSLDATNGYKEKEYPMNITLTFDNAK